MTSGHVKELWRYPASSLAGEQMSVLVVEPQGVEGDRLFGLIDAATGDIARPDRGPKWESVPRIRTRSLEGGLVEVAAPGGEWLPVPSPDADLAASRFLGFDAQIKPLREPGANAMEDPSTITARYAKAPIHLLTTASMARLKTLHPAGDPDARRFRPNIVVEMPEVEGHFPETEWIGKRIAIGELELTISEPCRRCGFTIIAQDGFDNDPNILRNLVRHNGHNMGVYCTVGRAGTVRVGDALRVL